jgi:hypothetical protein
VFSFNVITYLAVIIDIEGGLLRVGQRVEVFDMNPMNSKWCEAWVVDEATDKVKVHYKVPSSGVDVFLLICIQGFVEKWDEWISRHSRRICPYGRHLKQDTEDAKRIARGIRANTQR